MFQMWCQSFCGRFLTKPLKNIIKYYYKHLKGKNISACRGANAVFSFHQTHFSLWAQGQSISPTVPSRQSKGLWLGFGNEMWTRVRNAILGQLISSRGCFIIYIVLPLWLQRPHGIMTMLLNEKRAESQALTWDSAACPTWKGNRSSSC